MNNDSSSIPAADLLPRPPPPPPSDPILNDTVESVVPNTTIQDVKTPAQKRAHAQAKKRNEFLAGLLENLDTLIYMELSALYYMDCSFLRLLMRAVCQIMFLTPKPSFIPSAPQHRPYFLAVFIPNLLCIFLHTFTARPEGSEAMRGYLHGGIIVDLIGQKGPSSTIHLVLLDVVVLVLQCVMLAVHLKKENLSKVLAVMNGLGVAASTDIPATQSREDTVSAQDMDAEERGLMRHGITDPDEMEMETRNGTSSRRNDDGEEDRSEEHEQLLAEPTRRDEDDENQNPLDVFYTESARLATFYVIPALKSQWQDYGNASGSALQTVGFSAEFARAAASRRLNSAHERIQRQVDSLQ